MNVSMTTAIVAHALTKTYDDVQNRDEDVRRGYVQTECSLMVDYGGLTMAYLGNISKT